MLDEQMHGPYSWAQLLMLAGQGTISPDDMLSQEGAGHCVRARALRGLFDPPQRAIPAQPSPMVDEKPSEPVMDLPMAELSQLLAQLERHEESVKAKVKPEPVRENPAPPMVTPEPEPVSAITSVVTKPAAVTHKPEPAEPTPPLAVLAPPLSETTSVPQPTIIVTPPAARRFHPTRKQIIAGVSVLVSLLLAILSWSVKGGSRPHEGQKGFVLEEQESLREDAIKKPASAPVRTTPDLLSNADLVSRIVERLNRHRKEAGLTEVMLDPGLSKACAEHARYLAVNIDPRQATPVNVYTQDASKPEHTAEGAKTAQAALVAYAEPLHALDRWMGRLFSRARLLAPELERVGVGFDRTAQGDWICVLDPAGGRDEAIRPYPVTSQGNTGATVRAVVYPAANQKGVPCEGFDRLDAKEGPINGFPISVAFPPNTKLERVQVNMTDDAIKAIDIRVSSPEQPLNVKLQQALVGIHPAQPLEPGRTYLMIMRATANGAEWRQVWRFTTGK